jgi:hypothetical protein
MLSSWLKYAVSTVVFGPVVPGSTSTVTSPVPPMGIEQGSDPEQGVGRHEQVATDSATHSPVRVQIGDGNWELLSTTHCTFFGAPDVHVNE